MRKTVFRHSTRSGLVSLGLVPTFLVSMFLAAILLAALSGPTAAGSFTRGCAARDLQILMLIEERESANAVAADKLSDAMLALLEARIVCHEGHVVDAMALYDGIAESVTPDTLLSVRQR
jgi:hypothetical protein